MNTSPTTKLIKVATTAHRPEKLGLEYDYEGPYTEYAKARYKDRLIGLKADIAISGMAIGGDTIFAMVALELGIPVWAAIPFKGQESKWPKKAQDLYKKLLNDRLVTTYVINDGEYANWKFQTRNEWMVNQCDFLLALFNQSKGGTYNTVQYAYAVDKPVEIIDPEGWRTQMNNQKLF